MGNTFFATIWYTNWWATKWCTKENSRQDCRLFSPGIFCSGIKQNELPHSERLVILLVLRIVREKNNISFKYYQ